MKYFKWSPFILMVIGFLFIIFTFFLGAFDYFLFGNDHAGGAVMFWTNLFVPIGLIPIILGCLIAGWRWHKAKSQVQKI